jgi:ATP-dependent Clp protease, protease subunit
MADHYVFFGAEINQQSAQSIIAFLLNIVQQAPDRLILAMNSPGGNVVDGITIYQTMLAMPYPIITHNVGNVDSIANAIFLAGTERYASPASTFMYHGVGFKGDANERLEENNLKAKLDTVLSDHRRRSGIFSTRTQNRITVRAGMNLFKEQRTRSAEWALDNGVVMAIRDFVLPSGAIMHTLF